MAYNAPVLLKRIPAEATGDLYLHALTEIGLVLFIITLLVNAASRALIWAMGRTTTAKPRPVVAEATA